MRSLPDHLAQGVDALLGQCRVYILARRERNPNGSDLGHELLAELLPGSIPVLPDVHPGEVFEDVRPVVLPVLSTRDPHAGDPCEVAAECVKLALGYRDPVTRFIKVLDAVQIGLLSGQLHVLRALVLFARVIPDAPERHVDGTPVGQVWDGESALPALVAGDWINHYAKCA